MQRVDLCEIKAEKIIISSMLKKEVHKRDNLVNNWLHLLSSNNSKEEVEEKKEMLNSILTKLVKENLANDRSDCNVETMCIKWLEEKLNDEIEKDKVKEKKSYANHYKIFISSKRGIGSDLRRDATN